MPEKKIIAKVIIDLPVKEVDRIFDYLIPTKLTSSLSVGSMVVVQFGSAKQVGYVVGFASRSELERLSLVEAIINEKPAFDESMVDLCFWIAKYYLSTFSEALKLAIPPGFGRRIIQSIKIIGEHYDHLTPGQVGVYNTLRGLGGDVRIEVLKAAYGKKDISAALKKLISAGLVERHYDLERPRVSEATTQYAIPVPGEIDDGLTFELKRAPKQKAIMEWLLSNGPAPTSQVLAQTEATHSSLRALFKRGLISLEERPAVREPEFLFSHEDKTVELTDEQHDALLAIVNSIETGSSGVFLLQGVTGSGKTEVYLRSIQRALDMGKSAIALVPEIALTAQMVARFKARFGGTVAVLHSNLGHGERFDQWRGIQEGKYRVVVGARSAVFAPISNLGIIVVDEEHEASYRQGKNPRYNAREVAVKRAELEGACVVLGSATPSLESKWNSENGIYRPLFLRERVHKRELPQIEIVDMRNESSGKERSILSGLLRRRLNDVLSAGEKAILFLNRRGFSSFIICEDCGFVPKCRNCAVSLTYHSVNRSLRCHHCNYMTRAIGTCPECGSYKIRYPGTGTQRVEAELLRFYPEIPVIRMDADTTSQKNAHQRQLLRFKDEKSAILLGTQMVAKGLDFPEVTLVGVINADTSLHLPDFRAAEHTFQLLMQVSGRAGRGERPGRVVIQTHSPRSYPIRAVLTGDYDSFYKTEVDTRRELSYPPFSRIIRILFYGHDPNAVVGLAGLAAKVVEQSQLGDAVDVIGPSPAPLLKVKGDYRWHMLLKVRDNLTVKSFLEDNFVRLIPQNYLGKVNLAIDVDPIWVL